MKEGYETMLLYAYTEKDTQLTLEFNSNNYFIKVDTKKEFYFIRTKKQNKAIDLFSKMRIELIETGEINKNNINNRITSFKKVGY